jgi:hypothetical protein
MLSNLETDAETPPKSSSRASACSTSHNCPPLVSLLADRVRPGPVPGATWEGFEWVGRRPGW